MITSTRSVVQGALRLLGLYSDADFEVASTIPAPPPSGCDPQPVSAPSISVDCELGAEFGERNPPSCPETWK